VEMVTVYDDRAPHLCGDGDAEHQPPADRDVATQICDRF
jgi:hypothetical protein